MKRLIRRFGFALNGWRLFFKTEENGRLQAVAALLTVVAGLVLSISPTEWLLVLLCIGGVLSLEMINSAMEKLCDHVHPQQHPQIKWVKDVTAGAVLWMALISALVGGIIFLPKALHLFTH